MADIKLKDIKKLETWNKKELRKLRMTLNNRIQSFQTSSTQKEFPKTHPLFEMDEVECKLLLDEVLKIERNL